MYRNTDKANCIMFVKIHLINKHSIYAAIHLEMGRRIFLRTFNLPYWHHHFSGTDNVGLL